MISTPSVIPSRAREPVVLSWSGGKDSSLALRALRADPSLEVVGLLTSITSEYDRVSIHGVRRSLLEAQARAVGLPVFEVTVEPGCTNDDYETAFLEAVAMLRRAHPSLTRIAYGDLFLEDVRAYRERLMARSGLAPHFPLWQRDTRELAHEFIALGFDARLVCVDTTQLSGHFAGRRFDHALLAELPGTVDACGENGEFHTFVAAGPIFASPVPYRVGSVVLRDERFAYCDLLDADDSSQSVVSAS